MTRETIDLVNSRISMSGELVDAEVKYNPNNITINALYVVDASEYQMMSELSPSALRWYLGIPEYYGKRGEPYRMSVVYLSDGLVRVWIQQGVSI